MGQDDIAGVEKDAGADVDALLGRGRNLHLRHRDTVACGYRLPELRNALGRAVLKRTGAVLFQH